MFAVLFAALACGGTGGDQHGGGGGAGQSPAPPQSTLLARGVVAALPDATLLMSVSDVSVPAGGAATATAPGLVYVVSGSATVPGAGDVAAQRAAFLSGPTGGTVTNSGSATAEWFFLSVEAASARSQAPPLSGAKRLIATDDLPPLPRLNQAEALTQAVLPPGAQSDQYRPNGVEVLVVTAGTIKVVSDSFHGSKTLGAGSAGYELEGTQMQIVNAGSKSATYLSFILLPDGKSLTRPGR